MTLEQFATTEELNRVRERTLHLESKLRTSESMLKKALAERDEANRRLDFVGRLEAGTIEPPPWAVTPKKSKGEYHGTVNLMLSDLHFDEVVKPEQIDWYNKYNREIAELRLTKVIESTIRVSHEFFTGLKYDGAVLFFGGDIFSGIIHEDLKETNEAPILASIRHWEARMASAVERLASAYGNLLIACTYGNHGRLTLKPVAKHKAQDSFEWLMYNHVADHFKGSKAVTWMIPDAPSCLVQVYNHISLLTHGDQFKGGSGISGAMAPLMLGSHRMVRREGAMGRKYHRMVTGHRHRYMPLQDILINGSLKGYDEYSFQQTYEPEPAQQAFWIVTPEHGITWSGPIVAQDRKREGW